MLNIFHGRRDLLVIVVGRMVSTFGDGVALVALMLRLQADGAAPYEVAVVLAAGSIPLLLLARPVGRLVDTYDSRRLLLIGGVAQVAATIPLIFLHAVLPTLLLLSGLAWVSSLSCATLSALLRCDFPRVQGRPC